MKQLSSTVDEKIRKLLYKKDWRYKLGVKSQRVTNSLAEQKWNSGDLTYVDINIAEIIDWIYDKHEMWVSTFPSNYKHHWKVDGKNGGYLEFSKNGGYDSPKEAYIEAIKYVLNNLI